MSMPTTPISSYRAKWKKVELSSISGEMPNVSLKSYSERKKPTYLILLNSS